jgi:hypothetical protein
MTTRPLEIGGHPGIRLLAQEIDQTMVIIPILHERMLPSVHL